MRKRGTCRLEIKMVAVDPNHIWDRPGEELHLSVCLSLKAPEDISIAKPLCIWVSDSCLHLLWMRPNPPRRVSVCIPAAFLYLPRAALLLFLGGMCPLGVSTSVCLSISFSFLYFFLWGLKFPDLCGSWLMSKIVGAFKGSNFTAR